MPDTDKSSAGSPDEARSAWSDPDWFLGRTFRIKFAANDYFPNRSIRVEGVWRATEWNPHKRMVRMRLESADTVATVDVRAEELDRMAVEET